MSKRLLANPAFKDHKEVALNEEWANFSTKIVEVSGLVKDLASGDKDRATAAQILADKYLTGKVITGENVMVEVKSDRTVINHKAFRTMEKKDTGEMDKNAWMAEMSKDAQQRAEDRKVRMERADTLNTQAIRAFRRAEYDKALSCYNRAIEQIKDNPRFYCDRALTNIKLRKFDKVIADCEWALRLYEGSYKARLYKAKAYKELEDLAQLEQSKKELQEMFPQHQDLTEYFLDKTEEGQGDDKE